MQAHRFRGVRLALFAFAVAAFVAPSALAQDAEEEAALRPADLTEDHVGQDIVVESRVYRISKSRAGIQIFLDADTATGFQVVIANEHIGNWGADPEKRYAQGRNLRVRGELSQEGETLFIRATDSDQIDVIPRRRRRR